MILQFSAAVKDFHVWMGPGLFAVLAVVFGSFGFSKAHMHFVSSETTKQLFKPSVWNAIFICEQNHPANYAKERCRAEQRRKGIRVHLL